MERKGKGKRGKQEVEITNLLRRKPWLKEIWQMLVTKYFNGDEKAAAIVLVRHLHA